MPMLRNGFAPDWDSVPADVWARTQLVYVCSPDNPTGRVAPLQEWQRLFELADRHDFTIAADECYSEIYFDESKPTLSALSAAHASGRSDYRQARRLRQPVEALERAGPALRATSRAMRR